MEAPINNLLFAIPNQASNFALACVEHLLDDQISHPKQMALNLKRIGSVVSDWGLALTGEVSASGDAGDAMQMKHNGSRIALLRMPIKARHLIFSYLENTDIMNLRLVCPEMLHEIDHIYGLPVIMDTSSTDSTRWLQNITSRNIFVTRLDNLIYFNFLPKPEKLESIRFHKEIPLPSFALQTILGKFSSLRDITFFNKDNIYDVQDGVIQLINPTSTQQLLEVVATKPVLGLRLRFDEISGLTEWAMEMKMLKSKGLSWSEVQNEIGYLHLTIPQTEVAVQKHCLAFLDNQKHLFEMYSDLPSINWQRYSRCIKNNCTTLTGLHLLSLNCSTKDSFDCGVLKHCENLRFFSVSGEYGEIGVFLPVIGLKWLSRLRKLCTLALEKVYLTHTEFRQLHETQKKVFIRLFESMVEKESIPQLKMGPGGQELTTVWNSGRLMRRSQKKNLSNIHLHESEVVAEDLDMELGKLEDEQMTHFYSGFNYDLNFNALEAEIRVSNMLKIFREATRELPSVGVFKGLLVTAWLAMC